VTCRGNLCHAALLSPAAAARRPPL
jgi:hypothetical protein